MCLENAAGLRGRKVRNRGLPHGRVGLMRNKNVIVVLPVVGIGLAQVDDHGAFAVHAAGSGVDVAGHLGVLAVRHGVGVVLAGKVARDRTRPHAGLFVEFQRLGLDGLAAFFLAAGVVDIDAHGARLRRPHLEGRGVLRVNGSQIGAAVRELVEFGGIHLIIGCFFVVCKRGHVTQPQY